MRFFCHLHLFNQDCADNGSVSDDDDDDDGFRPLVIDTSASQTSLSPEERRTRSLPSLRKPIFPSFVAMATSPNNVSDLPQLIKPKASNSVGYLRDYLEEARPPSSVSPPDLDPDPKPLNQSRGETPPSTKGSAPSKSRRKSDRVSRSKVMVLF